jgi:excisionase family DNA binding protein
MEDKYMNGNGLLTIKEASELVGINQTTIYRKIKKGQLHATAVQLQGIEVKKVKKDDIIRLFGNYKNSEQLHATATQVQEATKQLHATATQMPSSEERKSEIREVIEQFFSVKQAELVKPIEQQSLYRLGRVEQENSFLKAKVETLLEEIEKYKALPWQIEERDNEIKELEARHQQEKEKILKECETELLEAKDEKIKTEEAFKEKLKILPAPVESINQILLENAHNLKILQKQTTELIEKLKQEEEEKEKIKTEAEEAQKAIVEAWKKELELAKKPWWKFW